MLSLPSHQLLLLVAGAQEEEQFAAMCLPKDSASLSFVQDSASHLKGKVKQGSITARGPCYLGLLPQLSFTHHISMVVF